MVLSLCMQAAADAVVQAAAATSSWGPREKASPPSCPGGQPAQVARRPTGVCCKEVDKNYHVMKLRSPTK